MEKIKVFYGCSETSAFMSATCLIPDRQLECEVDLYMEVLNTENKRWINRNGETYAKKKLIRISYYDTVIQAQVRPLEEEIQNGESTSEECVYIVSWNDHFFVLEKEKNTMYIIDTLGESEGLHNDSSVIREQHKKENNSGIVCKGTSCCKEIINGILAAIPLGELQRKSEEARILNEVEANEKRIKKDLEKQHVLRQKVDNLINQNYLFKRSIILIKAWCYYERRILEDDLETKGDVAGKCINEKLTSTVLLNSANSLTNDGTLSDYGYQNRLHALGVCLYDPEDAEITAYPWDPRVKGLFFHQTTVSIAAVGAELTETKMAKRT
ncbi:hypothetical protein Tco_1293594 [Tanacetum coccineum]